MHGVNHNVINGQARTSEQMAWLLIFGCPSFQVGLVIDGRVDVCSIFLKVPETMNSVNGRCIALPAEVPLARVSQPENVYMRFPISSDLEEGGGRERAARLQAACSLCFRERIAKVIVTWGCSDHEGTARPLNDFKNSLQSTIP